MDDTSFFPSHKSPGAKLYDDGYHNYIETARNSRTVCGRITRFGKVWFVKSLAEPFDTMSAYTARLDKEFNMLVSLNHPGIVRPLEITDIPGVGHALVLEYLPGETLTETLQSNPDSNKRRKIADSLIEAVAYLHDHDIVHLDLKPDNIIISPEGRATIIDFGLSDSSIYDSLKEVGGTEAYAAPEQLSPGYTPHPTADVYALGHILRQLHPGKAYTVAARHALRVKPTRRPATATDLAKSIKRIQRLHRYVVAGGVMLLALAAVILFIPSNKDQILPSDKYVSHPYPTDSIAPNKPETIAEPDKPTDNRPATKPTKTAFDHQTEFNNLRTVNIKYYRTMMKDLSILAADTTIDDNSYYTRAAQMYHYGKIGDINETFLKKCPDSLRSDYRKTISSPTFMGDDIVYLERCARLLVSRSDTLALPD